MDSKMADKTDTLVAILIKIQEAKPVIKNLKDLATFIFDNLNPRKLSGPYGTPVYGVYDREITDFLTMFGLEQEQAKKLLGHLHTQAFLKCTYNPHEWYSFCYDWRCVYDLNFK